VGLYVTLAYIREVGRENLIGNAATLAKATREAAKSLGLNLFATSSPANALTAIRAPEGMDSGAIVKEMRTRFGAIIANGQGTMKGKIFRLAHLGYYDALELFAGLAGVEIALQKLGHPCELGSGVRAAQKVYMESAE
jgi:aspartate aminotransferase-like enzyme